MDFILAKIQNQERQLGISRVELSEQLGMSRRGLDKALSNFINIKLNTLIKLCDILKLDIEELIIASKFNPRYAIGQMKRFQKHLNLDFIQLGGYTGMTPNDIEESYKTCSISYFSIQNLSKYSGVPIDYFNNPNFVETISLEDYCDELLHIRSSNLISDFFKEYTSLKINIRKVISDNIVKVVEHNLELDVEYVEKILLNNTVNNCIVSILVERTKYPIVVVSNWPTNRFNHIVQNHEKIFSKIKSRFLNEFKNEDIIWVANEYSEALLEHRRTSIIEYPNLQSPQKVNSFLIYDYSTRIFDFDRIDLKLFLNNISTKK